MQELAIAPVLSEAIGTWCIRLHRMRHWEKVMNAEHHSLGPAQPGTGQATPRTVQTVSRFLLGAFLALAGTSHLTVARAEFLAQVPTWLPVDADLVVILSGVAEIALGLALVFLSRQLRLVGLAVAGFFILIFPGNISQYVNRIDAFGLNTDQARFIRLFFQPVLVLWALWSTGAGRALFTRKAKTS